MCRVGFVGERRLAQGVCMEQNLVLFSQDCIQTRENMSVHTMLCRINMTDQSNVGLMPITVSSPSKQRTLRCPVVSILWQSARRRFYHVFHMPFLYYLAVVIN